MRNKGKDKGQEECMKKDKKVYGSHYVSLLKWTERGQDRMEREK